MFIDPHRLDFINIRPGDHSTGLFTIDSCGSGILEGTIETSHPWIKTSIITVNQTPGKTTVLVTVTANHLTAGKKDLGYIRITTNAGIEMLEVHLATAMHIWEPRLPNTNNDRVLITVIIIGVGLLIALVLFVMVMSNLGYFVFNW